MVHITYLQSIIKKLVEQILLYTTLCDKVCQWLAVGQWFSPGTLVSSINKTDCHDIIEILLKPALNTITLTQYWYKTIYKFCFWEPWILSGKRYKRKMVYCNIFKIFPWFEQFQYIFILYISKTRRGNSLSTPLLLSCCWFNIINTVPPVASFRRAI